MKKFFGWLLIIAGIGNFIGNFAKASANRPDAFQDIVYGIGFFGLGIYLLTSSKSKKDDEKPDLPANNS